MSSRRRSGGATVASAGNAGVAYAAYCARAGIKLWLFVSSLVPSEKMREAMLYGAFACLPKPYNKEKIILTVREALEDSAGGRRRR